MKWPSANSSDRKSVFYTSEDSSNVISTSKQQQTTAQQRQSTIENNMFSFGDETMTMKTIMENPKLKPSHGISVDSNNGKIKALTSEPGSNNDVDQDWKRYLKNFMLFSNLEKESEKFRREQQLAKIMKALMYFESKLRKEQEVIQQQLSEKDRVINRQMHTISNMKEKLGASNVDDDDINLPDTSGYCPMCRKKYYHRALKSISTQTSDNKFSTTNISDDYSSIPSIEYMSSSEEQEALLNPNPFSKARRSKKYTSKKSYKNYLQARPRNNSTASDRNSITNDVDPQQQQQQSTSDSNNNNITVKQQSTNGVSKSFRIASSGGGGNISGAGKFSLIMNDIHGIKHQHEAQSNEIYDDTHSSKINRMHGISRSSSLKEKGREALPNDDDDDDDETRDNHDHNNENERGKSMENDNQSAINNKIDNVNRQQSILVTPTTTTTKYCDEDLVVKQKIATRDDWYMSDVDETETAMSMTKTPYGNVTGVSNSVLECVNQILLQQSMDEFMDTQHHHHHHHQHQQQPSIQEKRSSFASNDSKDSQSNNNVAVTPPTRTNKRVHFSTKNSMVQITPLPPRQMLSDLHDNSTYENQSAYSNEYEPIGSARTYVDMDSKSLDNYKPKLPPKPDNLMKLSRQRSLLVHEPCYVKNRNSSDYDLNGSEPDYCSISEIQDNINSVKVVTAEIHNEAAHVDDGDEEDVNEPENDQHVDDDNEYDEIKEVPTHNKSHNSSGSSHTLEEVAEESFEDVPKLPNVYSIVPLPSTPIRKESTPTKKIIGHDNYITKSPMKNVIDKGGLPLA